MSFQQYLTEQENTVKNVKIEIDTSKFGTGIDTELIIILKQIISDIQDFGIESLKVGKSYSDSDGNKVASLK